MSKSGPIVASMNDLKASGSGPESWSCYGKNQVNTTNTELIL